MKAWWNQKALPWLKKWGPWIIFPLGLLLLAVKVFRGTPGQVVSTGLQEAAAPINEANAEAAEKEEAARAERDKRVAEVHEVHAETVKGLTDEQMGKVNDLLEDPEELNSYLLGVGKRVRDEQN
jgi:hypothetical protein